MLWDIFPLKFEKSACRVVAAAGTHGRRTVARGQAAARAGAGPLTTVLGLSCAGSA